MKTKKIFRAMIATALVVGLSGCVTTTTGTSSISSAPKGSVRTATTSTAMQAAIDGCIASIGGGIVIGALLGKKRGALAGGLIGGASCAALLEVAHAKDRARIAAEEAAAVRENRTRTQEIKTQSGKVATVQTVVRAAPKPKSVPKTPTFSSAKQVSETNVTACRTVQQTVSVESSSSQSPAQVWCRVEGGDWQPWG